MWNGKNMIWNHIAALYHDDLEQDLHQLPKLTVDHTNPTSFSKMKVCLAAQVMSNTVAMALHWHYPKETVRKPQSFVRWSTTEHIRKRNEFLAEYTGLNDSRFDWLHNVFIAYIEDW
jgi:hypothetical protein